MTQCSSGNQDQVMEAHAIQERMARIKHKIVVLSGKGGVGKSTVAANMAMALAFAGNRVGLLDIDVHGPSIPKLMGLEGNQVAGSVDGIEPVSFDDNLKVLSIGFLIKDSDDAVIWRGPLKYSVIKQFLKDVAWGDLDFLIVDSPPGTGDEPLSIVQLLNPDAEAVIVTTPQQVAISDVRKSIQFCRKLNVKILGIIENMSGFVCPHCGGKVDIFKEGGGEKMAREMGLEFLGRIPIDPAIVDSGDSGRFFLSRNPDSIAAKAFNHVIQPISALTGSTVEIDRKEKTDMTPNKNKMIIAIPTANGILCPHFGHCEVFTMTKVDLENKEILSVENLTPPAHEPGLLPRWLHEQGAGMIIAGGMGARAQQLFTQNGIQVQVGAPADNPESIIRQYLDGKLQSGANLCDH